MIIKSHLCGIAVAFDRFEGEQYEDNGEPRGQFFNSTIGRPQGSRYSQQKRKIADACEYMRIKPQHKPIIFVATSPGFTDLANEKKLIQKFTHNLRNGYGCSNYVWVREFTQMGFPHFHFVADMPRFDVKSLSLYWSGLFNSDAVNSIRLGTAPRNGKRVYYLTQRRMSWYLTKYLGKAIGKPEAGANKTARIRTFAVSQQLAKLSAPKEFKGKMVRVKVDGEVIKYDYSIYAMRKNDWKAAIKKEPKFEDTRQWQMVDKETGEVIEFMHDEVLKKWNWQFTGFANTYLGYPKEWKLNNTKK